MENLIMKRCHNHGGIAQECRTFLYADMDTFMDLIDVGTQIQIEW